MIELVIVSRLLEYPDAALAQHQQELFDALASSENLDKDDAQRLGVVGNFAGHANIGRGWRRIARGVIVQHAIH